MEVRNDRVYNKEISVDKVDFESNDELDNKEEVSEFQSITKSSARKIYVPSNNVFSLKPKRSPTIGNSMRDLHSNITELEKEFVKDGSNFINKRALNLKSPTQYAYDTSFETKQLPKLFLHLWHTWFP